jgi:hypothetical protein
VVDKYYQRSINLAGINAICLPAIRQLTPVTGTATWPHQSKLGSVYEKKYGIRCSRLIRKGRRRLKLCACAGLDRVRRAVHINGHREQSKVHKQIRAFSAPVHAGARRLISVLVGCGILTLPDGKNSLVKPTALHRGGEIEQMKKCFLDTTA